MNVGGIVLCGGQSSRMGVPKALLPVGSELMLQRVVRLLSESVGPIVVVAAAGQSIPTLPLNAQVTHDRQESCGPLAGLQAGLAALIDRVDLAYATSCDVPMLVPGFVRRMIEAVGDHDVSVPVEGCFHHPLAAVYRTSVLPHVDQLLAQGLRRPVDLFDRVSTRRVPIDELRDVDPQLATLTNLNEPADYVAALETLGLTVPDGVLGRPAGEG